jgi:uncharacterized OB-fold protein
MFKWFGIVNHTPHTKVAAFAEHLRAGRIMASRCRACGHTSFPPRADCERCLAPEFEFVEISGRCRLYTYTCIHAAPSGFEAYVPYTIAVVDLEEGGRALAWIGRSLDRAELKIGMELRLVPRLHEEIEEIKVDYTLERIGAESRRADAPGERAAGRAGPAATGVPRPEARSPDAATGAAPTGGTTP